MSGYVSAAAAIVGAGVSIDQGQRAQHQARLAAEQQQQQFQTEQAAQQAALMQQRQMNDANLAQAAAAAAESKALMDQQLKSADEATNRANARRPDTNRALSSAQQQSRNGASGTMLTGSQGVAPSALTLGGSTLLGQ